VVLLLAALSLAGCQGPPSSSAVERLPRGAGPVRGIDLPIDASDVINELKTSRLDFVARYYRDPASRWPTLSAAEAQRLSALGLKIVTVWEWHSHDPAYFSYASGYSDALNAYRQAKAVGQPGGSAIYFAVDFNARGQNLQQVDQYFRGIAAGFAAAGRGRPEYKVGVYGSGAVCATVRGTGLAQYSWLSNARAWEGSSTYAAWSIKQGWPFAHLSFSHDSNEAKEDYGGFRLPNYAGASGLRAAAPNVPSPRTPQSSRGFAASIRSWF
jgi:hypothetical protein